MGKVSGLLAVVMLATGVARAASPTGDVNAQAADGSTALLQAAYEGDAAKVAGLLQAGADPRIANQFGASPMGEAARRGDADVLRLLLKAGADPESPNPEGQTALMVVARTGNVEAAKTDRFLGLLATAAENQHDRLTAVAGGELDGLPCIRR